MELRTFRATTLREALELVRRELGPDAAILHTREVSLRRFGFLPGPRQIEVTASTDVNVPSRFQTNIKKNHVFDAKMSGPGFGSGVVGPKRAEWQSSLRQDNGLSLSLMQDVEGFCRTNVDHPDLCQKVADFLRTELGEAMAENIAQIILMKTSSKRVKIDDKNSLLR